MRRTSRRLLPPVGLVVGSVIGLGLLGSLAGCGGGSDEVDLTPAKVLALAENHLDDTSGVDFSITSDDVPDGVVALTKADGELTKAPAFKGSITVPISGVSATVQVVSVDGTTYAKLPLVNSWQQIDPADFGVPDPATLLDPDTGIASLLKATQSAKKGDSVRGGKDNKSILTEYSGTLPGDDVATVLPGAAGEFDVTYTIDDDEMLSKAVITGHFNGTDVAENTYTVTIDEYGVDTEITKP
ncbi:MAG: LppX_LprAFG lipoprotein [Nocardioides sp.]|uniref:LppX_LprAFG lipoprotein n=1 Tax=Nocardioides sp. TaxID=35761 RepID=UPI0039E4E0D6